MSLWMQIKKIRLLAVSLISLLGLFEYLQYDAKSLSYLKGEGKLRIRTAKVNDSRPIFVLHVGLHKTGTTSIQQFMRDHRGRLEEDHYVPFTVRDPFLRELRDCFAETPDITSCYQPYLAELLRIGKQGQSILISQEGFSAIDYSSLQWHMFYRALQENFQVRVIVYYRRYYEILPSLWNQKFKHIPAAKRKSHFADWPEEGGHDVPTFKEFFDTTYHDVVEFMPNTTASSQAHKSTNRIFNVLYGLEGLKSDEATKLDLHNYHCPDVLRDFFCKAVPNANRTCGFFFEPKAGAVKKNPSVTDLHYDIIALEAKQDGIVPEHVSRVEVKKQIENFNEKILNQTLHDLPQECLSTEEQEVLRGLSLEIERLVMPSMINTHDEGFANAKGKFCSVDASKLLVDERWRAFIGSIKPNNNKKKNKKKNSNES